MNQYFKASAKLYLDRVDTADFLIAPMSEVDCDINTELRSILAKAGLKEIADLLGQYKYLKDSEILDQLMQFNLDHPKGEKNPSLSIENEGSFEEALQKALKEALDSLKISCIDFDGHILEVSYLRLISKKISSHFDQDFLRNVDQFTIVINETHADTSTVPYSNIVLTYETIEERDRAYERLKELLIESPMIKFLN
jgi:hypothetical protein